MKLYDINRVQALENTDDVAKALNASRQRSLRARDRAARQREAVLTAVRRWSVQVPLMKPDALLAKAVWHYNDLWTSRGRDDKWATVNDDPAFLDRIAVNYLRHVCTTYEDRLDQLYGTTGAVEARPLLKSRILSAIARTYPTLADECRRQKDRLNAQEESS